MLLSNASIFLTNTYKSNVNSLIQLTLILMCTRSFVSACEEHDLNMYFISWLLIFFSVLFADIKSNSQFFIGIPYQFVNYNTKTFLQDGRNLKIVFWCHLSFPQIITIRRKTL